MTTIHAYNDVRTCITSRGSEGFWSTIHLCECPISSLWQAWSPITPPAPFQYNRIRSSNFLEMEMANKVGPHTISMDCPVCLAGTMCKRVTSDDIDDSCRNCDSTLSTGRSRPGPAYNYWPLALAVNGLNSGTLAQKSIPKNSTPGLFFCSRPPLSASASWTRRCKHKRDEWCQHHRAARRDAQFRANQTPRPP